MSANNAYVVAKIKDEYAVFYWGCVDNDFKTPRTTKNAEYVSKDFEDIRKWLMLNDDTEYGTIFK